MCVPEQLVRGSGIKGSLRGPAGVKAAQWMCRGTATWGIKCLRGKERVPRELEPVPAHGTVFVRVLSWPSRSRRSLAHPPLPGCALRECLQSV